ncbi:MAG: ComF family protein [Nitrospirae bacterium]|nr:MAG: ComF family protein [Nitrospirota bacterium]
MHIVIASLIGFPDVSQCDHQGHLPVEMTEESHAAGVLHPYIISQQPLTMSWGPSSIKSGAFFAWLVVTNRLTGDKTFSTVSFPFIELFPMDLPSRFLRSLFHLLLPVRCITCAQPLYGDPIPFFCRSCWKRIRPLTDPACIHCHRPIISPIGEQSTLQYRCGPCRLHPPAYQRAWTFYAYESPLKEAIGQFKYRGKVALAKPLAQLMLARWTERPILDGIIPVPLHRDRLREREFNQCVLLADYISHHLHVPLYLRTLIKTRSTAPQAGLTRRARLLNVKHAFAVRHPARVEGKCLLLVDDVFTTGTTVNECAKVLRLAKAQTVYVVTLARMV